MAGRRSIGVGIFRASVSDPVELPYLMPYLLVCSCKWVAYCMYLHDLQWVLAPFSLSEFSHSFTHSKYDVLVRSHMVPQDQS